MNEEKNTEETALVHESPFMDPDALIASVQETAEDDRSSQMAEGFNDILKLKKFGEKFEVSPWVYGEGNEVHPESVWVIDPTTLRHGFMGWEGDGQGNQVPGQLPDEVWTDWNVKWPEKPEGKPWVKDAYAFCAVCVSSPNEDQVGDYVSLSDNKKLGLPSYANIEQLLRKRVMAGRTNRDFLRDIYPVVQFSHEVIYIKKRGGSFNKPVVTVTGWMSKHDVTKATLGHAAPQPVPAPAAPSSEDESVEADTAPAGRASRRRT